MILKKDGLPLGIIISIESDSFSGGFNCRGKASDDNEISKSDWETHEFVKIKTKRIKCPSPYLETDVLERDEILFVLK